MLNKGKIIEAQRVDVSGQLITSIGLTVTPEMMPSFRIVAFYNIHWSSREEVVPDSIWVDVVDSCTGGVRSAECQGSEFISGSQAGSPAVEQIAVFITSTLTMSGEDMTFVHRCVDAPFFVLSNS